MPEIRAISQLISPMQAARRLIAWLLSSEFAGGPTNWSPRASRYRNWMCVYPVHRDREGKHSSLTPPRRATDVRL